MKAVQFEILIRTIVDGFLLLHNDMTARSFVKRVSSALRERYYDKARCDESDANDDYEHFNVFYWDEEFIEPCKPFVDEGDTW